MDIPHPWAPVLKSEEVASSWVLFRYLFVSIQVKSTSMQ